MKKEHGGDEEETHDEDWHRTDLDAGGIVRVEAPHASGPGSTAGGTGSGRRRRRGLALFDGGPGASTRRRASLGRAPTGADGSSTRRRRHVRINTRVTTASR